MTDSDNATRLVAFSDELSQSHQIRNDLFIEQRMKIAFLPPPPSKPRGRPKMGSSGEPPKKKRAYGEYRDRREYAAYGEALKHGSCFFFAYVSTNGRNSTVEAVQSLIPYATEVHFSLDTVSRKLLEGWAENGGYKTEDRFIEFIGGLKWFEDLPAPEPSLIRKINQRIKEMGLGADHTVLTAMAMLFPGTAFSGGVLCEPAEVETQMVIQRPEIETAKDGREADREINHVQLQMNNRQPDANSNTIRDPPKTKVSELLRDPDFWDIVAREVDENPKWRRDVSLISSQTAVSGEILHEIPAQAGTQIEAPWPRLETLEEADGKASQVNSHESQPDENWHTIQFAHMPKIKLLQLLRDPTLWEIVAKGVEESHEWEKEDLFTNCATVFEHSRNEDSGLNFVLGAVWSRKFRALVGAQLVGFLGSPGLHLVNTT